MAISSRMKWALCLGGLGVVGAIGVEVSRAQQGDGQVKQTANPGTTASPPKTFAPTVVGSLDLGAIIRGSEKAKFQNEQLRAEMNAKQAQQQQMMGQGKNIAKEMEALTPGTADFKDRERKLTEIKASLQANKENTERELEVRYSEYMASFYADLQDMIKRVSEMKGLTYVVQYSNEPVSGQDPQALMARIQQPVIYAHPDTDITRTVLYNLNKEYVAKGGKVVKAPVDGEAAPAGGAAPTAPATPPGNRAATGTNPATRKK